MRNKKTVRNLKESNYGWSISSDNAWDALDAFVEAYGETYALESLAKAMGTDELAENMEYICRQHDFEGPWLDDYDEDEDEDYDDEEFEESKRKCWKRNNLLK